MGLSDREPHLSGPKLWEIDNPAVGFFVDMRTGIGPFRPKYAIQVVNFMLDYSGMPSIASYRYHVAGVVNAQNLKRPLPLH